jgi:hypothetical protein
MAKQQGANADVVRMGELYGGLYYYLAAEMIGTFGEDGKEALKRAIRKFGTARGLAMRRTHEESGIPVNVEALKKHPDMPYGQMLAAKDGELRPDYSYSETLACPIYDAWKQVGGEEVGLIYCETIHKALWGSYDDRIEVEQPKIMSKGDDFCSFQLTMKP